MREKIRKKGKDSLTGEEGKIVIKGFTRQVTHSTVAHHPLINAQPVLKEWSVPFPPLFYCSAWFHVVWDIPRVSWGLLTWLCLLQNPCAHQPPPWQGSGRSCVLSTLFSSSKQNTALYQLPRKALTITATTRINITFSRIYVSIYIYKFLNGMINPGGDS